MGRTLNLKTFAFFIYLESKYLLFFPKTKSMLMEFLLSRAFLHVGYGLGKLFHCLSEFEDTYWKSTHISHKNHSTLKDLWRSESDHLMEIDLTTLILIPDQELGISYIHSFGDYLQFGAIF